MATCRPPFSLAERGSEVYPTSNNLVTCLLKSCPQVLAVSNLCRPEKGPWSKCQLKTCSLEMPSHKNHETNYMRLHIKVSSPTQYVRDCQLHLLPLPNKGFRLVTKPYGCGSEWDPRTPWCFGAGLVLHVIFHGFCKKTGVNSQRSPNSNPSTVGADPP